MTVSTIALLTLCFHGCLVQDVYSQCSKNMWDFGSTIGQGIGFSSATPQIYGPTGVNSKIENGLEISDGYGGIGVGELFANGMLPVEGYTSIAGQVPTIGVLRFDGPVQAKGSVSISGSCGCGCQF